MDRTQLDRLYDLLGQNAKNQVPVQTVWGIVKEVDWEAKTATVLGLIDNLEYYDVSLGIGNTIRKPKLKTKCIIGSIGNQEVDSFLIDCDEVDEIILIATEKTLIKISNDEILIEAMNKPININSSNSRLQLSEHGIDINSDKSINLNGGFEALYNKTPGVPIVDVSQIGISKTVKIG